MPGPGAQEYAGAEGAQGPVVREVKKPLVQARGW